MQNALPAICIAVGWGALLGCGGSYESDGGMRGSVPAAGASGVFGASEDGGMSGSPNMPDCAKSDVYCVTSCTRELVLVDNATCADGTPSCAAGYVLSSTCDPQACGVEPGACCDLTTGVVTENQCNSDGHRSTCPDGSTATNQAWCIPTALGDRGCSSLEEQPCTRPIVGCRDFSLGETTCECRGLDSNAASGIWQCLHRI